MAVSDTSGPLGTGVIGTRDDVARQYENWIYPLPQDDLDEYARKNFWDFADPKANYVDMWPASHNIDGTPKKDLAILIAGCGANAAARYARNNPEARVVGVDLSEASLAHEEKLKQKYNLQNLTLKQLPIEEVHTLGMEFDLIESSGVLHHLESPLAGLQALRRLLKPDGVIAIMLYGRYGRTGIYMLQELFMNMLKLPQTKESVDLIRSGFDYIHPGHPAAAFTRSLDLQFDAGVVDLFLHPIDRGYTVRDCLNLTKDADMVFQYWSEPCWYHPTAYIGQAQPVMNRMKALAAEKGIEALWEVMELWTSRVDKHAFFITRPDRDPATYTINFEGKSFLDYKPWRRINEITQPDPKTGMPALLHRIPHPPIPVTDQQAIFINATKNKDENPLTIREIIKTSPIKGKRQDIETFARTFYKSLYECGLMGFRIPHPKAGGKTR